MKRIKVFTFLVAVLIMIDYACSAEKGEGDLWNELKARYPVFYEKVSDEEINKGFSQIERQISYKHESFSLPETLKEFYREVGNLGFYVDILSPVGGEQSVLYREIDDVHKQGVPDEWLVFAKIDENDFFCINYQDGKIARFSVIPEVEKDCVYKNLSEWTIRMFLKD